MLNGVHRICRVDVQLGADVSAAPYQRYKTSVSGLARHLGINAFVSLTYTRAATAESVRGSDVKDEQRRRTFGAVEARSERSGKITQPSTARERPTVVIGHGLHVVCLGL